MHKLILILCAFATTGAQADLVNARSYLINGTDFTGQDANGAFIWGMDVNPINNVGAVDVDGNGEKDFHESATTPVNPVDGLASQSDGTLFRWDYGNSPSRAAGLETGNNSYTLELALDIKSTGTEGARGVFGIALDFTDSVNQGRIQMEIERTGIHFQGGTPADPATVFQPGVASQSNEGLHTWRISYDAANTEFWIFRDNELLNLNGAAIPGATGLGDPGITLIGDYSGGLSGDWDLDYIALDATGAFAVVPEPGTLALFGLGLALLARRISQRA